MPSSGLHGHFIHTHMHHNLKINLIFKKQMEARVKIKGLSPSLFTVVVEAVSH